MGDDIFVLRNNIIAVIDNGNRTIKLYDKLTEKVIGIGSSFITNIEYFANQQKQKIT